jgi:hypothetical protein
MTKIAAVLLATSLAFTAPAFAQDQNVTLQIDSGSVMASTGGDYASATNGQALASGQKIMVNEGSSATLVYGNGCKMELSQPGVYTVPGQCNAVASTGNGGSTGTNAAIIAGTAAVVGALIDNEDNHQPGPVSGGMRTN